MSHSLKVEIASILASLSKANNEYSHLAFDESYTEQPCPPCNPEQLDKIETIFSQPLPLSYRCFLEMANGWPNFWGDASLLSVEEQNAPWVHKRIEGLEELFREYEDRSPFAQGALPVLLGKSARTWAVLEASYKHEVVVFDQSQEVGRYTNFVDFLRHNLALLMVLIDDEKNGIIVKDKEG